LDGLGVTCGPNNLAIKRSDGSIYSFGGNALGQVEIKTALGQSNIEESL
jgi:alpha-tubulin suppressor-like RCC1 family protein